MSDNKIFAGPRIKKLRKARGLSQIDMAHELGISASYLNLIERNTRPLTVQLILQFSKIYGISPQELEGDSDGSVAKLKEIFSDPLLQGELPGHEELFEVADIAPNVASGLMKLHDGYRQALLRLSELNAEMINQNTVSKTALPTDLVHAAMESRPHYYDILDRAAEELAKDIDINLGLWAGMQQKLLHTHRIRVQTLPIDVMPEWVRRFDRHTMRVFISDRLNSYGRVFELACDLVYRELQEKIDAAVLRLQLSTPQTIKAGRIEMIRYAALALILPYNEFIQNARVMKYDVEALAKRFDVSFEQIAVRLTTLSRSKEEGIPFFMQEVDQVGNVIRKLGWSGFPKSKFGGRCPKLSIFRTVSWPQQLLVQIVEQTDGHSYLTLNRSTRQSGGAYGQNMRQTAIMLACPIEYLSQTIYGQNKAINQTTIGPNCHLCERPHCAQRATPPVARPLVFDNTENSVSTFNFKI